MELDSKAVEKNKNCRSRVILVVLLSSIVSFTFGIYANKYTDIPNMIINKVNIMLYGRAYSTYPNQQFKVFNSQADIVFIGDSMTAGINWNEVFRNVRISNRAIYGQSVDEMLARLDTVLSVKPKKAFIMGGVNDIYNSRDVNDISNDYKDIIGILLTHNIEVFVQSTFECSKVSCGARLLKVRELNKLLRQYIEKHDGVTWIDVNQYLSDENGLKSEFSADGIHVNIEGYLVWTKILAPYIDD